MHWWWGCMSCSVCCGKINIYKHVVPTLPTFDSWWSSLYNCWMKMLILQGYQSRSKLCSKLQLPMKQCLSINQSSWRAWFFVKFFLFNMTLYVGVRYHALARAYSQQHVVAWWESLFYPRPEMRRGTTVHVYICCWLTKSKPVAMKIYCIAVQDCVLQR